MSSALPGTPWTNAGAASNKNSTGTAARPAIPCSRSAAPSTPAPIY